MTRYFNYSYKRASDYHKFKIKYLENKKTMGLYAKVKCFLKFQRYCQTRWLSMGSCLDKIIPQWTCLQEFMKHQVENKKELKLESKTIDFLDKTRKKLSDNSLKFIIVIYSYIFQQFNEINELFQSNESSIHLVFPKSRELFNLFNKYIDYDEKMSFKIDENLKKLLQNDIQFDRWNYEFTVKFDEITEIDLIRTLKLFREICCKIKHYLPYNDINFEAFQTINPLFRFSNNSLRFFRDRVLKNFRRCYPFEEYASLIEQYTNFTKISNENLNMAQYEVSKSDFLQVELFWKDILKNKKEFEKLSKLMINLMLIPHSNAFVERMFSHVKIIKNEIRNTLDVATVSSLIKIKSFYLDSEELFEPNEDHYNLYHNFIKKSN